MTQILNGELTLNHKGEWLIKETIFGKGDVYEYYVPLHPDDILKNYTEHTLHLMPYEGKKVKFKVETIAVGTSENDVMDKDVGKIVMWS